MARPIEHPTVTEETGAGGDKRRVQNHPAYGQIGASRVSGSANLYGSDFNHRAYMTIRIARSQLNRDLSNDWHYAREEVIEVALSEAQWATFVSAPNVGSGVPCTIMAEHGIVTPGLPDPETRQEQFAAEMVEIHARVQEQLAEMATAIEGMNLPKTKAADLKHRLGIAQSHLSANGAFVANQFGRHMETTVERAKAEVHGYMSGFLMRAGLERLGAIEPIAMIEDKSED